MCTCVYCGSLCVCMCTCYCINNDRVHCPSLQEAIAAGQFHSAIDRSLDLGNVQEALEESKQLQKHHLLKGEMRVGGQEHFYMETSSCVCVPKGERREMDVIAATEDLQQLQRYVCQSLKAPPNCVNARVRRLGVLREMYPI